MDMSDQTYHDESRDHFYSAEFQLQQSNIMYQFKLRRNRETAIYAVLKEGSQALDTIREGDVIDMRYHYLDEKLPSESILTRILSITKDSSMGFKDHYVVRLSLDAGVEKCTA